MDKETRKIVERISCTGALISSSIDIFKKERDDRIIASLCLEMLIQTKSEYDGPDTITEESILRLLSGLLSGLLSKDKCIGYLSEMKQAFDAMMSDIKIGTLAISLVENPIIITDDET